MVARTIEWAASEMCIRDRYRIGKGPSSSHTMGPNKADKDFAGRHPEASSFEVTLYGRLAATGKGHMTDVAIIEELERIAPVRICLLYTSRGRWTCSGS